MWGNGRAAIPNFWRGVPWGKAAIADFLAENLPRGEGSYRQFLERRALGEGSYRRFFGREFAEPAACEGRLAKGSKVWKTTESSLEKDPKSFKNATLEAPGSSPGSSSEKDTHCPQQTHPCWNVFLSLGVTFGVPMFCCFLEAPPEWLFMILEPKGILWKSILEPF